MSQAELRRERKVVTVLFADLVGFTSRAEQLDPEDVEAILRPYHQHLRRDLERHGGTVEKFIGDAVMAVFGAPVAREDDPERAVRAALVIRDAIVDQAELELRIGIATGEALVTLSASPGEGEGMVAGDVVNTAARLQAAAPANGILVGESTYRATERVIEYGDAEPVRAKGKSEPVGVWEALQPRARVGGEAIGTQAPMVGRRRELDQVADALARARQQRSSQLVTLVGVPGIGKSRLVFELMQLVEADPELIYWRQGRSLPYGEGVTFWALSEMVKAQAGILDTDPADEAETKLQRAVSDLISEPDESQWVERHLRPLVGLGTGEGRVDDRDEAFAAWRRFFEGLAEKGPVVLVFDDLHWADDGLLDFVDYLLDWVTDLPVLVLCTARQELLERRPNWAGGKLNAATISLGPLSDEDTSRLLAALLGRTLLAAEVQAKLLERAGGNPLYAEQFARMLEERDPDAELPMPEGVQGIIAARLDVLPSAEKALIQDASVVGKVFWLGALAAVGSADRATAERLLQALERKDFVGRVRRGSVGAENEYLFRHLLVRDVAYGQIPRAARAQKHLAVARWVEELSTDRAEDRAELLANHYVSALELSAAAGEPDDDLRERARVALENAGDRALGLGAYVDAARLYGQALELTEAGSVEAARLRLSVGQALGLGGLPGTRESLERASAELLEHGEVEGAAQAEVALADLSWEEGRRDQADAHMERARALVEDRQSSVPAAWVAGRISRFLMLRSDYQAALDVGTRALRMAEELRIDELRAHVLNNIGGSLWGLGDESGLDHVQTAIEVAEAANSPFEMSRAYVNLAAGAASSGQLERSHEFELRAEAICARFGVVRQSRWVQGTLVFTEYMIGDWASAEDRIRVFVARLDAGEPHYLAAEVYVRRGLMSAARGRLEEACADAELAVGLAREAKDNQLALGTYACAAHIFDLAGRRKDAEPLVAEFIRVLAADEEVGFAVTDLTTLAWPAVELGRGDELASLLGSRERWPWARAARAYCEGRLLEAADLCASTGALPIEAYTRLRAAEQLVAEGRGVEANDQVRQALALYRSVGATAFLRRAETLLPASA